MTTKNWAAAVTGGTASAAEINQFLYTHEVQYNYLNYATGLVGGLGWAAPPGIPAYGSFLAQQIVIGSNFTPAELIFQTPYAKGAGNTYLAQTMTNDVDMVAYLVNDNTGAPGGTIYGQTIIPCSATNASAQIVACPIQCPGAPLSSGTYWIVLTPNGVYPLAATGAISAGIIPLSTQPTAGPYAVTPLTHGATAGAAWALSNYGETWVGQNTNQLPMWLIGEPNSGTLGTNPWNIIEDGGARWTEIQQNFVSTITTLNSASWTFTSYFPTLTGGVTTSPMSWNVPLATLLANVQALPGYATATGSVISTGSTSMTYQIVTPYLSGMPLVSSSANIASQVQPVSAVYGSTQNYDYDPLNYLSYSNARFTNYLGTQTIGSWVAGNSNTAVTVTVDDNSNVMEMTSNLTGATIQANCPAYGVVNNSGSPVSFTIAALVSPITTARAVSVGVSINLGAYSGSTPVTETVGQYTFYTYTFSIGAGTSTTITPIIQVSNVASGESHLVGAVGVYQASSVGPSVVGPGLAYGFSRTANFSAGDLSTLS